MQPPTQGGGRKRQNLTLDLNPDCSREYGGQNAASNPRRRKKKAKFNARS